MTKRETKRRRARARSAARGDERAQTRQAGAAPKKPRAAPVRTLSGLEWLSAKNRLSRAQRRALEAYGLRYRLSVMEGADALRSCLDITPRGGAGGVPTTPTETAAWIAKGRAELCAARSALDHHAAKIAVCDLIAGRGLSPRDITKDQIEGAEIETTLRLAGDELHKHFQGAGVL